ncbi:MAG: CTP synthase [Chlamydiae bacterium SM23_39]|nr:MAG: CTP synthase [Chlamydiae bacterium SM23_39]
MPTKYIFITGGVLSSLGKGLAAASIANLLESQNFKIGMLKLDPYLNIDPGTMNPFQHGEIYVTDDGAETDLDLGHYYRFTNTFLSKLSNATSGQIYHEVIKKERKGDYLGKTVQVIPHITDEIKKRILLASKQKKVDFIFIEVGGTVGDIESLPFLEAIRQFKLENNNSINIHLTYVPFIKSALEFKTKPTQQSTQILRGIGIIPEIILCRCEKQLSDDIKSKISLFCNVKKENVIEAKDVKKSIYEVPLEFHKQGIDKKICHFFKIKYRSTNLTEWKSFVQKIKNPKEKIKIAIVGKYLNYRDAYKSIYEALLHTAYHNYLDIDIKKIESDKLANLKNLKQVHGILIPGGFGKRGWEGKILACKYAREKKIPFFGICLGMQALIVEFARNILKLKKANSTEMDPKTKYPVISLMIEQKKIENLGGTMRLGAYICSLKKKTKIAKIYQTNEISERHRHRYEFNNEYKKLFEEKDIIFSGILKNKTLCEIVEIKNHPCMFGVQFHPEFKSKPLSPHPLFNFFIKKALECKKKG